MNHLFTHTHYYCQELASHSGFHKQAGVLDQLDSHLHQPHNLRHFTRFRFLRPTYETISKWNAGVYCGIDTVLSSCAKGSWSTPEIQAHPKKGLWERLVFLFSDIRIWQCSPGWHQTYSNPPASASQMLRLQACFTTPSFGIYNFKHQVQAILIYLLRFIKVDLQIL